MIGGCEIMWNFSRNGHAKGPHDGVGAVIKMEKVSIPLGEDGIFYHRSYNSRHEHHIKSGLPKKVLGPFPNNINEGKFDNFKFPLQCEDHIWRHL